MSYHFRVHYGDYREADITVFIKQNSDPDIIVREVGDRPHIHSIITPTKTKSTFIQKFLLKFPDCKGNGGYSCMKVDNYSSLLHYLCKGADQHTQPEVIGHKASIDISKYHDEYWIVNKSHTVSFGEKKKKEKVYPFLTQVKMEFESLNPVAVMDLSNPICIRYMPNDHEKKTYEDSKKDLLRFLLKMLGKSVKILNDGIIINMFKGIMNAYIQEGSQTFMYGTFLYEMLDI